MKQHKHHLIVTVGRQLGAGGRSIARLLANEFNLRFYDSEILNLAAKESGFSEEFFRQNDEHKGFLRSLFHLRVPLVADNNFYSNGLSQESLFKFQSDAIRKAAEEADCVFVGRCADYILRDEPRAVSLFVTARLPWRVEQVKARRNCSDEEALKIIREAESRRATYYNYYTGKRWGAAESYDLCVDASRLGIAQTARHVAQFITDWQNSQNYDELSQAPEHQPQSEGNRL